MSDTGPKPPRELSRDEILDLFALLNRELAKDETRGELYLVGGAVMCLVFEARPSTRDVDAWFRPSQSLRRAAARVAHQTGLPVDWLNDGVKGFLGDRPDFAPFLELSNLAIFAARPEYLLAMKCMAMRIGAGFRDEADVRFLLRALNIIRYDDAVEIVLRYFDEPRVSAKTRIALQELLPEPGEGP